MFLNLATIVIYRTPAGYGMFEFEPSHHPGSEVACFPDVIGECLRYSGSNLVQFCER
jgi:hypothetical protein